jgi:DNA-binding transcriptional MerR regulator
MRAVARLTGLSPDVIRAWERRYAAVEPTRTPGGTRRYGENDVARLRLLAEATRAGHAIGSVARLPIDELKRLAGDGATTPPAPLTPVLDALRELDAARAEEIAARQLAALGPARFARDFALPLAHAVGDAWAQRKLCIASEHLGTALLRTLLGAQLRPAPIAQRGPTIVFATLPDERHELGTLCAALVAAGAGCNPVYLGPDLPVDEIVAAARLARAAAVALSVVAQAPAEAGRALRALRRGLASGVAVLVGGPGAKRLSLPEGVEVISSLEAFEQRVFLLVAGGPQLSIS